jgi:hypothetical protein
MYLQRTWEVQLAPPPAPLSTKVPQLLSKVNSEALSELLYRKDDLRLDEAKENYYRYLNDKYHCNTSSYYVFTWP